MREICIRELTWRNLRICNSRQTGVLSKTNFNVAKLHFTELKHLAVLMQVKWLVLTKLNAYYCVVMLC